MQRYSFDYFPMHWGIHSFKDSFVFKTLLYKKEAFKCSKKGVISVNFHVISGVHYVKW